MVSEGLSVSVLVEKLVFGSTKLEIFVLAKGSRKIKKSIERGDLFITLNKSSVSISFIVLGFHR